MSQTTRCQVLARTTAGAATAFAALWIVPTSCFGTNERIVTGHIGFSGQGNADLRAFLKLASPAAKICEGFGGYRKRLDRKNIDAVVIPTSSRPYRSPWKWKLG